MAYPEIPYVTGSEQALPQPDDKDKLEPDADAIFFKRQLVDTTNSPVIPFYRGFRERSNAAKVVSGQNTDRHGNRLDKDMSKNEKYDILRGASNDQPNRKVPPIAFVDTARHRRKLARLALVQPAKPAPVAAAKPITQTAPVTEQSRREYVLEVIGLGVTLDKYRQGKLWEALQKGNAHATVREQDIQKYTWDEMERYGIAGGRGEDTLDTPDSPSMGLAAGAAPSGMHWHLFLAGPRRFGEYPDRIREDVFAFFDANPDVLYIVLNAEDSMSTRDLYRPDGMASLVRNGYYIPEMPDASALFVLARRERIDAVRKFAFDDAPPEDSVDDLNNYGVARRLYLAYDELTRKVPRPEPDSPVGRVPLIEEWLPVAAQFARRTDIRGTGSFSRLNKLHGRNYRPPKDWQPTPWFPVPFNQEPLAQLDRLPTLGFIHRPTFVKMVDEHGKPLMRRDERERALQAGWQEALRTLREAERPAAPARLVAATGGDQQQLITLHKISMKHAEDGGTELDSGNPAQWIDTDRRLGNTGAATWFVQMAIAVMDSYRDGGVSAAVNLRNRQEASIVLVSPPSEEKRRTQKHPDGGDVFAHHGTPAIDPANYPTN